MRVTTAVFALFLLGVGSIALADGITAKEAVGVARAKATAWQADAELIMVGADIDKTGRVVPTSPVGWQMSFWSQKANKQFDINIGGAKQILKSEEAKFRNPLKPFKGEWVDSDAALAAAVAQGLKPGIILNVNLSGNCPAGSKDTSCWEVLTSMDKKTVTYVVGGASGKFVGMK
jgi:hypothetical protein